MLLTDFTKRRGSELVGMLWITEFKLQSYLYYKNDNNNSLKQNRGYLNSANLEQVIIDTDKKRSCFGSLTMNTLNINLSLSLNNFNINPYYVQ